MKITPSATIHELIETYPFLIDFLAGYNPKFSLLKNSAMRATMGRMATLSMAADIGGVNIDALIDAITKEINRQTGNKPAMASGVESASGDREKLDRLKDIILSLHQGVPFETAKTEFDRLMSEIEPTQIATMEEQLIREGMPATEVQRLCDLHVTMFRDLLEKNEVVAAPVGHPVHTYQAENTVFAGLITSFDEAVQHLKTEGFDTTGKALAELLDKLALLDIHYVRKENQLFPYLEKHGVTGPSQVMWGIHDEIRGMLKELKKAASTGNASQIIEVAPKFSRAVVEMIFKENSILFPMAMDTLSPEEWRAIRKGEDEVGYAHVSPGSGWPDSQAAREENGQGLPSGGLSLDTGSLSLDQINLMLKHLPVEVSFVDENDEVRYYSDTSDRIFPRSPGVIGRKVQNCHPPKSLHIVNNIVEAFKSGTKDSADFRIELGGRMISISYFAVRDAGGTYRGTIEVTQDITGFLNVTGEKRLLDWDTGNIV